MSETDLEPEQLEDEEQEPLCELWEVRDHGTLRAMHTSLLLIEDTGRGTWLHRRGWQDTSATDAVLAAAGFTGSPAGTGAVEERHLVEGAFDKLRGFRFPRAALRRVQEAMRLALSNAAGGYRAAVLDAVSFHATPMAFALAWEAAESPAVLVRTSIPERSLGAGPRDIRAYSDKAPDTSIDWLVDGELPPRT